MKRFLIYIISFMLLVTLVCGVILCIKFSNKQEQQEIPNIDDEEVVPTSASLFTFDGNSCTGYVGDNSLSEIVIPKTYSIETTIENYVGAKVLNKETLISNITEFNSIVFSDGKEKEVTYNNSTELENNLLSDFQDDCYLVSIQVPMEFSLFWLNDASDLQWLQFPLNLNGKTYKDGTEAFDYIMEDQINNVNFGGEVKLIKYVDGTDYQVNTVSGFDRCSGFENYKGKIILLSNISSIGDFAFLSCFALKDISIPASVSSIGESAFLNCKNLTKIEVDPNNNYYSSEDGVLFDKNKTTLIQYPEANERTTYEIPSSVITIGSNALNGCSNLISIIIPEGVKDIGGRAFQGCSSLTSITIPSSVTSIGDVAFNACKNLSEMTILSNTPPTLGGGFAISWDTKKIYIPIGSINKYQTAEYWSNFASLFEELPA